MFPKNYNKTKKFHKFYLRGWFQNYDCAVKTNCSRKKESQFIPLPAEKDKLTYGQEYPKILAHVKAEAEFLYQTKIKPVEGWYEKPTQKLPSHCSSFLGILSTNPFQGLKNVTNS